jgi:hypothetical protein
MVRVVDRKHRTDQKLTQPTANDFEESLKKVLLGSGQDEGAGDEVALDAAPVSSSSVVSGGSVTGDVVVVGGLVGGKPTACRTMGSFASMQF